VISPRYIILTSNETVQGYSIIEQKGSSQTICLFSLLWEELDSREEK
jgi:hypothetical protein